SETGYNDVKFLLIVGTLFLIACSVNLIGILLGKFLARGPQTAIHRALGANRWSIFVSHLLECELIALFGGMLGTAFSFGIGMIISRVFENLIIDPFTQEGPMVVLLVSLVAGLVAGLYPAWRICRVPPAIALKSK
ncbi:MAG: FtsX-like permease family protein, partial [Proteobacteria bacterium]|nr:FtsX-like permease family protein [Pseudomonadota bacterium]